MLAVALGVSVVTDLLQRRILDVITYPCLLLALVLRLALVGVGGPEAGLLSGVLGGLLGGLLFVLAAWRGKMGWGDAKLMAAVGAIFGYPDVVALLVFVSLAGALQAVVSLLWQGAAWQTLRGAARRWAVRARLLVAEEAPFLQRKIPYGVAIAAGSVWALFWR